VKKTSLSIPLLSILCTAPLVVMILSAGFMPDSDRAAHSLWAGQLLREGSLSISPDGVVDDWKAFYPNTVPKPADLFLGVMGTLSGPFLEGMLWTALSWAAIFGAIKAAGGGLPGTATGVFLGLNPVFLNLCITRSPAVPFMALITLASRAIPPQRSHCHPWCAPSVSSSGYGRHSGREVSRPFPSWSCLREYGLF